jgi:hypothetical protein
MIPICRNRRNSNSVNIILAIENCSLLEDFLEVTRTNSPTMEFWSNLEEKELNKRLEELDKSLPTKKY